MGRYEYTYRGPVMEFDICIERNWTATTWAQSPSKALSNLTYRYKKEHDRASQAKISLPGKLVVKVDGKERII